MVEIKNLTKIYKNGKGIKDMTLKFDGGDIVGLVGDNGAGKSTLIKTIFSEIKKDSGDVLYNGESIYNAKKNYFSFFPDQSYFPRGLKILEYMYYFADLNDMPKKEYKYYANYLLNYFGLGEYKNKSFKHLSAGMQKRALLAISLVIKPKVIFLDEPTANMDIKNRIELIEVLRNLAIENKTSIFITSHILDELNGFVNKVFIMEDGELVHSQLVGANDNIKDIYLRTTRQYKSKGKLEI